MNTKGAMKINWWLILGAVLLIYLFVPQVNMAVNNVIGKGTAATQAPEAVAPATGVQVTEQACGNVDTTVKFESNDALSKGTDDLTSAARVFLNGVDLGYKEDGSTLEVSPGDKLRVFFFENSTDATATTSYYTLEKEITVPCKETLTMLGEGYKADNASTIVLWNADATVNTASATQAMGADSSQSMAIRIQANSKAALGNPTTGKDNVMCFMYNVSTIKDVSLAKQASANVPVAMNISTEFTAKCYSFPTLVDNAKFDGTIVIESAGTAPAAGTLINVYLWDTSIALNADTLEPIYGVEDEDHNDLGLLYTMGIRANAGLNETIYLS